MGTLSGEVTLLFISASCLNGDQLLRERNYFSWNKFIFSLSGQSPGRVIVLLPAFESALASASGLAKCPCDRSCLRVESFY